MEYHAVVGNVVCLVFGALLSVVIVFFHFIPLFLSNLFQSGLMGLCVAERFAQLFVGGCPLVGRCLIRGQSSAIILLIA
jgi:hypothetical protein